MLECNNCGFKFILVYPLRQQFKHTWGNYVIKCPVCKESMREYTTFATSLGNPNVLMKEE